MGAFNSSEEIAEKALGKIAGKMEPILKSNKPINSAFSSLLGGLEFGSKVFSNPNNLDSVGGIVADAAKSTFTTPEGALRTGKIAGSYIGAAGAYRVLSGGGAYKDKNGNTNLIGIPFV